MNMDLIFLLNSILLGIGLAMDAFSVSMANGLHNPSMRAGEMSKIAGVYGFFQFAMPMIGWICVHTIVEKFRVFEKFIPWIALILLLYIGGELILEGIRGEESEDEENKNLSFRVLIIQGIATSIDALSVGFTIADYGTFMAFTASMIIAVVTFAICIGGLQIGKTFGTKLSSKANFLGGTILIFIGLEIFVKGVFF